MLASETAVGRAWLENFVAVDRPTATMLLDSLRFAGFSVVSSGLRTHLRRLVDSHTIETPVLTIPERGLNDFEIREGAVEPLVAFDDFLPGGRLSVTPGSEGLIGRLLRDFAEAGSTRPDEAWLPPDAGLEVLRSRKCRSIVIATDYIGSGSQILKLAEAIGRNRTIRSWRSRGLLKVYVVSFAATPTAISRLERTSAIDAAWPVEGAPSFGTAIGWTDEARAAIRDLCITETRISKKWALGWADSAGLFVSEHGVPNNLPAVFWQTKRWRPLFPGRQVPGEVAHALRDTRPRPSMRELAEIVGQLRIGRNQRIDSMPRTSALMLKLLVLYAKGRRSAPLAAAQLGLDLAEVVGLTESLERLGLLDADGRVTVEGRKELAAQKRARRYTTAHTSGEDRLYYPQSLR